MNEWASGHCMIPWRRLCCVLCRAVYEKTVGYVLRDRVETRDLGGKCTKVECVEMKLTCRKRCHACFVSAHEIFMWGAVHGDMCKNVICKSHLQRIFAFPHNVSSPASFCTGRIQYPKRCAKKKKKNAPHPEHNDISHGYVLTAFYHFKCDCYRYFHVTSSIPHLPRSTHTFVPSACTHTAIKSDRSTGGAWMCATRMYTYRVRMRDD